MKTIEMGEVLFQEVLVDGIFELILSVPAIAKEAKAGQFVELYTGKGEMLLPRPISICQIDKEKGTLRLLYQAIGKGTTYFSTLETGDTIKVMGPLGNGFSYDENKKSYTVIGGGIGVPPLLQLVQELKGEVNVFIGAKTNPILVLDMEKAGAKVHIATDDGSVGFHGNAVELLRQVNPKTDMIFSCGPKVMLREVARYAQEKNIPAQVSMEERMACGIGACVGCAVKIRKEGASDWQHLKVCKDGPVFLGAEVVWDE